MAQSPAGLLNESGGQVTDETTPKGRTHDAEVMCESNHSGIATKQGTEDNTEISKEGTEENRKSKVDVSESEEEKGQWGVPEELRSTLTGLDSQMGKSYVNRIGEENTKSKVDVSDSEEEKGPWDVPEELRSTLTGLDSQMGKSYVNRIGVAA
jgi:hypothetical protein